MLIPKGFVAAKEFRGQRKNYQINQEKLEAAKKALKTLKRTGRKIL